MSKSKSEPTKIVPKIETKVAGRIVTGEIKGGIPRMLNPTPPPPKPTKK